MVKDSSGHNQTKYPNKDKAKGELNHSLQVTAWGMAMP